MAALAPRRFRVLLPPVSSERNRVQRFPGESLQLFCKYESLGMGGGARPRSLIS